MKSFISLSIGLLFSGSAFAAGPYALPNFSGTDINQAVDPAPVFDAFYKADEREPASVKAKPVPRFPSNVSQGFEYKVKMGNRLSAFWVVKRGDHFELIFANNAGSKASFTIPVEHFTQLNAAARGLRAPASNVKSCKDGYVSMQFYDGSPKKTLTTCLNLKKVDQIKQLGAILSSYVR